MSERLKGVEGSKKSPSSPTKIDLSNLNISSTAHMRQKELAGRLMMESLTSEQGYMVKRGNMASSINRFLPKGYRIDFNENANDIDIGNQIRIVEREGGKKAILVTNKGEEKEIGTVNQWGNENKAESKEVILGAKIKNAFLKEFGENEKAKKVIDNTSFVVGTSINLNGTNYTVLEVTITGIKIREGEGIKGNERELPFAESDITASLPQ